VQCEDFGNRLHPSVRRFQGTLDPLINNLVVCGIRIEPHDLGYMESLREVPIFLNPLFTRGTIYFAPPIVSVFARIVIRVSMLAWLPTPK